MEERRGRRGSWLVSLWLALAWAPWAIAATQPEPAAGSPAGKVDPWVLGHTTGEPVDFLVVLAEQADLTAARALPRKADKGRFVHERLTETARRTQAPLLAELTARGVAHRPFWIVNMISVRGTVDLALALAARPDVAAIDPDRPYRLVPPNEDRVPETPTAIEWNITKVNAPLVWALGYTGQGAVVAGQDTGYDWDHPALIDHYRGWNGASANHDYDWRDAIHSGGGSCGPNSTQPCDDHSHGTHTMGTMVGDDGGANQIGMAPSAEWIGCRNMDQGIGYVATYTECFEFFIAPTTVAGTNPDPAMAPHVINNSWGCPFSGYPGAECDGQPVNVLQQVVENTRAAGIVVVVSAGNAGSSCSSVEDPPAIYDASFSVGSTTSGDSPSSFSSRGPVTVDGSNRLKPDISAPGSNIRSSVPGGGYEGGWSGTSMAGPHVAGLVALILSAKPELAGDVDAIEQIIRDSAFHPNTSTQVCGGTVANVFPNNTFGYGRIDALAAVQLALAGMPFLDGFETGNTSRWSLQVP